MSQRRGRSGQPPADVRIARLSEHPECLANLAAWFEREWPGYYGPGGIADATVDLRAYSNDAALPIGVVALRGDALCGVAALRPQSIPTHAHLSPWAGAGLVAPRLRRRGIGAMLLAALEGEALRLGFDRIYCATGAAGTLLLRNGWHRIEDVVYDGASLGVYEKRLVRAATAHRSRIW